MGDFSSLLVDDETFLDYWICGGHIDVISFLPEEIAIRIIKSLDMKSICRLAQTNRKLRELCDRDDIWLNFCLQDEIICEESEIYKRRKTTDRITKQQPSIRFWKNVFQDYHLQEQNWKKGTASQDLLLNFTFTHTKMQIVSNSYLIVFGSCGNSEIAAMWDITNNTFLTTLYDGTAKVRAVQANGLYAIIVCQNFIRIVSLTFLNGMDPLDIEMYDFFWRTPSIQFGLSGFFISLDDGIHYYSLSVDTDDNGHINAAEELVLKCTQFIIHSLCFVPEGNKLFSSHSDGKVRVWTNLDCSHPEDYVCTVVDKYLGNISEFHYCQQANLVIICAENGVFGLDPNTLNFVYQITTSSVNPFSNAHVKMAYPNMLVYSYDELLLVNVKTGKVKYKYDGTKFCNISVRGHLLLDFSSNNIAIHDIRNGEKLGSVGFPLSSPNRINGYCNTMDKIIVDTNMGIFVWDFRVSPDKRKMAELRAKEENKALKKVRL